MSRPFLTDASLTATFGTYRLRWTLVLSLLVGGLTVPFGAARGAARADLHPVDARQTPAGQTLSIPTYSEVSVSSRAATLILEFEGTAPLRLALDNGVILVDGTEVGRYSSGDPLDVSWRALLSEAVSAQNGQLAALLRGWNPPAGLTAATLEGSRTLKTRLDTALQRPQASVGSGGAGSGTGMALDPEAERSLLDLIVANPTRAAGISTLLAQGGASGAGATLDLRIGRPVAVEAGDVISGPLFVVDGDVRVDGTVQGDLLVLGGTIRLGDAGRVDGNVFWIDGDLRGNRDRILGEARELDAPSDAASGTRSGSLRDEIAAGFRDAWIQSEIERTPSRTTVRTTRLGRGANFFGNFVSGLGSLLQAAVTFVLLLGLGIAGLRFFPRRFEVVARTAASNPGRSLLVGSAGLVLTPFAYVSIGVVLTITIIGIPVAIAWLIAAPFILVAALLLGYLGVARTLGSWWVQRGDTYVPRRLDASLPVAHLGIGLALLLSGTAVAAVFEIGGGWFAVFRVLALLIAFGAGATALAMGMGAVLLSRGGQRGDWAGDLSDMNGLSDLNDFDFPEPDPTEATDATS
jgi:hypothetical protein